MVCGWFGLKTTWTVFFGLASKQVARVFLFMPRNDLSSKSPRQSWFGPQNQADFSLLVAPQNRQREDGAGHVSRSGGLLRLEASRARVY
jgi:hypothetical protein